MPQTNDTQRVSLSETYTDDLYYAATALVTRVEVSFNQDVAVFIRLSNAPDTPTVTLPLVREELDTFLDVYLPYLREQEGGCPHKYRFFAGPASQAEGENARDICSNGFSGGFIGNLSKKPVLERGGCPPLDVSRFAAWLAARKARVVGWPRLASTHPLACWLTVVHEEPCWVDTDCYYAALGDEAKPTPLLPWMSAFVKQLREQHGDDAVTGAQALEVLSLVQAELLTAALDEGYDPDDHPF